MESEPRVAASMVRPMTQMDLTCPKCASSLPRSISHCPTCGHTLVQDGSDGTKIIAFAAPLTKRKKSVSELGSDSDSEELERMAQQSKRPVPVIRDIRVGDETRSESRMDSLEFSTGQKSASPKLRRRSIVIMATISVAIIVMAAIATYLVLD